MDRWRLSLPMLLLASLLLTAQNLVDALGTATWPR
jgi:hypothetical protein